MGIRKCSGSSIFSPVSLQSVLVRAARHLVMGVVFMAGYFAAEEVEGAAPPGANYDEASVPAYKLPDPLRCQDGSEVRSVARWREKRRPELLELFREHVYGRSPDSPRQLFSEMAEIDPQALAGRAVRKRVVLRLAAEDGPTIPFVMCLPAQAQGPVPMFVGLHLFDSQAAQPRPGAPLFLPDKSGAPAPPPDDPALQELPGESTLEVILSRGYGIATLDARDFAPDDAATYDSGIVGHYRRLAGRSARLPDDWGAIGAWAWGLSRVLDYFQGDAQVDAQRVVVIGHSRMGKTALWAAAQDERFAAAISNNSGCGGAALSRRIFGETVGLINRRFPHWFCENFRRYDEQEADLPIDQHELLALLAPRPVYVASAEDDAWADPRGEFLAVQAAGPVFALWGGAAWSADYPPPLYRTVGGRLGYHLRSGRHALTDFDWLRYLDFADRELPRQAK